METPKTHRESLGTFPAQIPDRMSVEGLKRRSRPVRQMSVPDSGGIADLRRPPLRAKERTTAGPHGWLGPRQISASAEPGNPDCLHNGRPRPRVALKWRLVQPACAKTLRARAVGDRRVSVA
jgi:hypothetical protein